jgi:hypothetical protein
MLVIAKAPAQETAGNIKAESLPGTAHKSQNRPPIITGKIHRAVESLAAQCANDRPALADTGVAAPSWHWPHSIQPGQMIENGCDFLRHQHVQRAFGKMFVNRPQCRDHHDCVAEVFKLDRQDFGCVFHLDFGRAQRCTLKFNRRLLLAVNGRKRVFCFQPVRFPFDCTDKRGNSNQDTTAPCERST